MTFEQSQSVTIGHLLLDNLPTLGIAILIPLGMTVYGAYLRRLGGSGPTTGAEFSIGNAGTGFAALPVASSFRFAGITSEGLSVIRISAIIANLVLAILAVILQGKVDECWFLARARERGLKKGRTTLQVPKRPTVQEAMLWVGVYAFVAVNVVMFAYGLKR